MFPFLFFGVAAVILSACNSDPSDNNPLPVAEPLPVHPLPPEKPMEMPSGVPSEGPPQNPCPDEMAKIGRFCVDRYESHLKVDGQDYLHTLRPPSDKDFFAVSEPNVFPQAYMSRPESEVACRRAGKRLCTLEEWLIACRGPVNHIFPYGDTLEKDRCNSSKPHLLTLLFKDKDPDSWSYEKHFNNPILNETPGFLSKTGEYSGCVNEYGVFDMVGNLHEWVSDKVDRLLGRKIQLIPSLVERLPDNITHGIFMGGFYSTGSEHGYGCGFITIGHEPEYHDYSTGFRCCKDAK